MNAVCVSAVVVVVALGSASAFSWGPVDDYIVGAWHFTAGKYAKSVCIERDPDGIQRCFSRLPACRSLLYYTCDFTEESYALFVKYLSKCSTELNFNLNVLAAMPPSMAAWQANRINGLSLKHDLGLTYEQIPDLFACVHEKFHNVNAFKECINAEFD